MEVFGTCLSKALLHEQSKLTFMCYLAGLLNAKCPHGFQGLHQNSRGNFILNLNWWCCGAEPTCSFHMQGRVVDLTWSCEWLVYSGVIGILRVGSWDCLSDVVFETCRKSMVLTIRKKCRNEAVCSAPGQLKKMGLSGRNGFVCNY